MAAARRAAELGVALVIAAQDNQIIDICSLLTQGADVNYVARWMHEGEENSTTPLIQAAVKGHAEAVRVLISRGANVNKPEPCNGLTALHAAAEEGHVSVMELLVSKGAMVDARNKGWETPLVKAALKGHKEAAICLLDHGADVNAKDRLGFTPLSCAAHEGYLPLVDLLVLRGADLNLARNDGATSLIMAAQNGRLEVVKFLVEKGAVLVPTLTISAPEESRGTSAKACKYCGATVVPLGKCIGCETVYYCSPECQKKDWMEGGENRHKIQCARLVEMKARYIEKAKEEIKEQMERFGISSSNAE